MARLIDDLRRRFPGLAKRAARGVQAAAIRLHCIECMGGDRAEVAQCTARDCPLFEFRLNGLWCKRPKRTAEMSPNQRAALERGQANLAQNRFSAPTPDTDAEKPPAVFQAEMLEPDGGAE